MSGQRAIDKSELAGAGVLAALGAFVAWQAWDWPYLTPDGPGPGFFPLWIGAILVVLSLVLAGRELRTAVRGRPFETVAWDGAGSVLSGWAALVVSIALLEPAGFVASFALLALFLVRVTFRRPLKQAVAVALGSAVAFWIVFAGLLQVRLPAGPWGF